MIGWSRIFHHCIFDGGPAFHMPAFTNGVASLSMMLSF